MAITVGSIGRSLGSGDCKLPTRNSLSPWTTPAIHNTKHVKNTVLVPQAVSLQVQVWRLQGHASRGSQDDRPKASQLPFPSMFGGLVSNTPDGMQHDGVGHKHLPAWPA